MVGKLLPRTLEGAIRADLERKIVLLSGPRQCGKTTLARRAFRSSMPERGGRTSTSLP